MSLVDASDEQLLDELDRRMPLRRVNGERMGTFMHRALCCFAFAYHRKETGALSQQEGFARMLGAEEALLHYARTGLTDEQLVDELRGRDVGPVQEAISLAVRYGGHDEAHHKAWVIDQMVRVLAGDRYAEIVREAKAGDDDPETYSWDEGIAP